MRLHAWTYGPPADPPVLALHGVRNHGGRYRRLAADALGDARVIAPDLRGHGRSGWEPPWTRETHVADVLETLDALGVTGPVDVIGHSFGGLIACATAAAAPDRVRSLILLDPAAGLDPAACLSAAGQDVRGEGRAASWESVDAARAAWCALRPPQGRWALEEDLAAFWSGVRTALPAAVLACRGRRSVGRDGPSDAWARGLAGPGDARDRTPGAVCHRGAARSCASTVAGCWNRSTSIAATS